MNTTAPIIQQHELTWKCNNNCTFCYNPERSIDAFKPRGIDRDRNLAVAEASVARGVMAACPTGGEPLVVRDHFFEVLAIYARAGCYTSMNSNGRLITEKTADKLASAGLDSALISIHGLQEVHDGMVGIRGAFPQTYNGILRLKDRGIAVMPNFVATAKNIHQLLEVGDMLAMIGVTSMAVTPFLPSWEAPLHEQYVLLAEHFRMYFQVVKDMRSRGMRIDSTLPIPPCVLINLFPDDWHEYLDVHSPRVCMAGRSFGVVSPDAQFRACIQAPYLPEFGGSVLDTYTESWEKANAWAKPSLMPEACRGCEALDVCGAGCRTSSLWENEGSVEGKTMYMGEPLDDEQTSAFVERIVQPESDAAQGEYRLLPNIKVRDEGWGVIVFNPVNQSFTILSADAKDALLSSRVLTLTSKKVIDVLMAIGSIEYIERDTPPQTSNPVQVLPGNILLPRLAKRLTNKNKVYCLRADTGERYFF
jgi:radical SAM protein with 4Fe4S-binding SPASM domain